ncbi:M48 family metallopeptidase [Candidatus Peregrinibacteria bacterium]|nr:MAG: M48 family metallopeptidase [Candidatus Peregrinibacteria bacterium]
MNQIVEHSGVTIQIKKSARAKHLRLSIDQAGQFKLTMPRFAVQLQAIQFLNRHASWIEKQQMRLVAQKSIHPDRTYQPGETFFYLGEPLALTFFSGYRVTRAQVRGDRLEVYSRDSADSLATKKAIESLYRRKAEEVIRDRLDYFNAFYGFPFKRVTFRNQKSRWGSCSAQKNLNFNWRLIMAPIEVIDYVVVHELCHLRQMNHSARFWALVADQIHDYKHRRTWLKTHSYLLKLN